MFLYSYSESADNFSMSSLDDLIQDYAFKTLDRHRTGILYKVPIPSNFSGIEASVARLKSGSFWSRGANFSDVGIPPGSIPIPFVRRVAIVYQNLANWSSYYYNVPGYTLVTPVVGFLAYNVSNFNSNSTTKVSLRVTKDPISISFPSVSLRRDSMTKCARFDANGSVQLSEMTLQNVCLTRDQGHFSIVIPSIAPSPSPVVVVQKKKGRKWKVWVIACICGVVVLVLLGLVGMAIFKSVKRKKMVEMERKAQEGESLGSVWIGGSRMPSATFIRTQPTLENENAP
ncbi:uncharacterized protein LOC131238770 [Magnolia sinica]|uniref:uncharacterized protein LOC131238770 n=1 Tax=Magnolia sinica TaxID=86752 RepID=UPI00265A395B|nr:uncharacterized protein LOC131238770 [Magnolia sinica]